VNTSKSKARSTLPDQITMGGTGVTNDMDKANMFNDFSVAFSLRKI